MTMVETRVHRDAADVDRRLASMHLTREGLKRAVEIALAERNNATAFHPANAPGTLAYHSGTWALRDTFVGDHWQVDRTGGVESIRCDELKIRISFANVDVACTPQTPKPRSHKGAGAERASGLDLFPDLPTYAPAQTGEWQLFYLMVDERGAAELTRPVLAGGTFVAAVERIYLSDGSEHEPRVGHEVDDGPVATFDPQVARR